ncbi:MAG: hypothetical protein L6R37_005890 [Teloschistes peruensis]|nr:MAG: hypothetical protein L6R37_005890 [Teloschistes peruensis]
MAAATMPNIRSNVNLDLHLQAPPSAPLLGRTESDDSHDELEITFNKTLEGHYRDGSTGYKKVIVLFLTWEEDDMQCKETEVDALRDFFDKRFHYETDSFQIPKDRWQTALQKRIAELYYEFDSPDCLTILYYAGHGYTGTETQTLKLSAKVEADPSGDPTLFFNDILGCCRLPTCDQLLILDCCHAAKAYGTETIGKRKFEMIVSSGHKHMVPAPLQPGSFTRAFNAVLEKLLNENEDGFVTSQLYREIYHSITHQVKPWHFDQARKNLGRIVLKPQPPKAPKVTPVGKGPAFLNLTLELDKEPDSIAMNQLALNLQYLPHVQKIRFEKLYAPRKQIEDFMLYVQRAAKLRPFLRMVQTRRRFKKFMAQSKTEKERQRASNIAKMWVGQSGVSSTCDWSSALDGHNPSPSSPISRRREKSFTWPPVQADSSAQAKSFSNRFFSLEYKLALPTTSSIPSIFQPRRAKTMATEWIASANANPNLDFASFTPPKVELLHTIADTDCGWRASLRDSDFWYDLLMWFALCLTIGCFCAHLKE